MTRDSAFLLSARVDVLTDGTMQLRHAQENGDGKTIFLQWDWFWEWAEVGNVNGAQEKHRKPLEKHKEQKL